MSQTSPSSQLYILKIEVAHGSDRHDVSLYKNEPPTVGDLLEELEKKTRVPERGIQLIFRGQKLHVDPSVPLAKHGVFNGNRLLMIGEKLDPVNDAIFNRILGVGKDIALIEKALNELQVDFTSLRHNDRTVVNEYLPQFSKRCHQMVKDFKAGLVFIKELTPSVNDHEDLKRHHNALIDRINSNIRSSEELLQAISEF